MCRPIETPEQKKLREKLDADVREYLEKGGEVKNADSSEYKRDRRLNVPRGSK